MGNEVPTADEIAELVAAVVVQKRVIQTIFKARDFSAMPAAQQRLAQLQEELRILRHKAGTLADYQGNNRAPSGIDATVHTVK